MIHIFTTLPILVFIFSLIYSAFIGRLFFAFTIFSYLFLFSFLYYLIKYIFSYDHGDFGHLGDLLLFIIFCIPYVSINIILNNALFNFSTFEFIILSIIGYTCAAISTNFVEIGDFSLPYLQFMGVVFFTVLGLCYRQFVKG